MPGINNPVDLPSLHYVLWGRREAHDQIRLDQVDLAEQLGVSKYTMSRLVNKLVTDGRLIVDKDRLEKDKRVYTVANPGDFPEEP